MLKDYCIFCGETKDIKKTYFELSLVMVCKRCIKNLKCESCKDRIDILSRGECSNLSGGFLWNGKIFCLSCFPGREGEGDSDYRYITNSIYIERDLMGSINIKVPVIHNWSYKPRLMFFGRDKNRRSNPSSPENHYFGLEIEAEFGRIYSPRHVFNVLLDTPWVYSKYDSSINNGTEFVTHPLSLGFINEDFKILLDKFKIFKAKNLKRRAGLHVTFSRRMLNSSGFLKFIAVLVLLRNKIAEVEGRRNNRFCSNFFNRYPNNNTQRGLLRTLLYERRDNKVDIKEIITALERIEGVYNSNSFFGNHHSLIDGTKSGILEIRIFNARYNHEVIDICNLISELIHICNKEGNSEIEERLCNSIFGDNPKDFINFFGKEFVEGNEYLRRIYSENIERKPLLLVPSYLKFNKKIEGETYLTIKGEKEIKNKIDFSSFNDFLNRINTTANRDERVNIIFNTSLEGLSNIELETFFEITEREISSVTA